MRASSDEPAKFPAAPSPVVKRRPPDGKRRVAGTAAVLPGPSAASESDLLGHAFEAMTNGKPESALEALTEHARRFPGGQLEEEREALWIQALIASGQVEDARVRAARFRSHFPASIQLGAVDAALRSIP